MQVWSMGQEDPMEEEMATHSRIFTWEIPWIEELVGYNPLGHKELDMTEHMHIREYSTSCLYFCIKPPYFHSLKLGFWSILSLQL